MAGKKESFRETLRKMRPGAVMVIPITKNKQIRSISACASYLKNDEPELGMQYTLKPNRKEKYVVVIAERVDELI